MEEAAAIRPIISVEQLDGEMQLMGTSSVEGLRAAAVAGNGPSLSQEDLENAASELGKR